MFVIKSKVECYHLKFGSSNKIYTNTGFQKYSVLIKERIPVKVETFSMNFDTFKIKEI